MQATPKESKAVKLNTTQLKKLALSKLTGDIWDSELSGYHVRGNSAGALSFRLRYTSKVNGKRRVITIGEYGSEFSADQARTKAMELARQIASGVDPLIDRAQQQRDARIAQATLLGQFIAGDYAKTMAHYAGEGASTSNRLLANFSSLYDRPMSTISEADLIEWVKRRESDGVTYSTIDRALSDLQTVLNEAAKAELITHNPIAKFNLFAHTKPLTKAEVSAITANRKRRALTNDETRRLFAGLEAFQNELREQRRRTREHAKGHHLPNLDLVTYAHETVPFVLLAYWTGFRPGDLTGLQWEHLNHGFTTAQQQTHDDNDNEPAAITKVIEKTSRKRIKRGQEEKALQTFHLATEATDVLQKWWEQCGRPTSGLVFPSERLGGGRHTIGWYKRSWDQIKKLGKLELAMYSLRHNFATRLLHSGTDIFTVSKLMGHSKIETTIAHYGHLLPDASTTALARLSSHTAMVLSKTDTELQRAA